MLKRLSVLLVLCLISGIYACSGGDNDPTPEPVETITGNLIDSAVAGVHYDCATSGLSGDTDSAGAFTCNVGETVTFSIGGIDFPAVVAATTITPLTLADTTDVNDQTVVNISRFLQTLDSDGDPSNGITISDDTITAATDLAPLDFTLDITAFEAAFDEINDVLPNTPVLISEEDAKEHLQDTLDDLNGVGNTSDERDLNGTYLMISYGGKVLDGDVVDIWSDVVNLSFDGAGNVLIIDVNGEELPEEEDIPMTYSIADDGTLTSDLGDGIVGSDGNSFICRSLATASDDDDTVSYTGIKKSSGMSNASLNGTYVMTYVARSESSNGNMDEIWSEVITASYDGAGNGLMIDTSEGEVLNTPFTYSIADDGTYTGTLMDTNLVGIVGSDGNSLTYRLVGTSGSVHIWTGIKKSSGMSNASLNGTYVMTSFGGENLNGDVTEIWSDLSTVSYDGAGNGLYIDWNGEEVNAPFTYSIEDDGTFTSTLDVNSGVGIVGSDGNSFTFRSVDSSGGSISMVTGFKKR